MVEVERKRVRNVNLRIRTDGTIYVSASPSVPQSEIERFVRSKRTWIDARLERMERRAATEPTHWADGEQVSFWGSPLSLKVIVIPGRSRGRCEREGDELRILVPEAYAGDDERARERRATLVEEWRRTELASAWPLLFTLYEGRMGVQATSVKLRRMKTRWGSCNVRTRVITLNTELTKFPGMCLESVVVHELCHLLEPTHNARFHELNDRFYPNWKAARRLLNQGA